MKVRDLIERLSEEDPDMEVRVELRRGLRHVGVSLSSMTFEVSVKQRLIRGPANYVVLSDRAATKDDGFF